MGKSSLLNALVGRRALAQTSRTPGKTRMCNVFDVAHAYYLVDLPGYGYARRSRAERASLSRLLRDYMTRRRHAGIVWLLDIRRDPGAEDLAMGDLLANHSTPVLTVFTKVDKLGRSQRSDRAHSVLQELALNLTPDNALLTSARTGEGIRELRLAVERLVRREAGTKG